MVNKIDTANLEQHISELDALAKKWGSYNKKVEGAGENSGGVVTQIQEMAKTMQTMQDAFSLLVKNSASYMRQRKDSVEIKDAAAASAVRK